MRLQGLTVEECRESLAEAISLILEDRREAIMRKGKTGNDARSSLELLLSHANEQSSDSVELEYVPEGLEITYMFGNTGVGTIVKDGQEIREIIDAVVKLKRRLRGRQGGHRVRISGFEVWQIGADGLIAESLGHFDSAAYQHQLEHGVYEAR